MMDEVVVAEEVAYGCTGISTAIAANMLAVSSHTMHHTLVSAGHCKETVCYGQLYYTWTCALCESVCVVAVYVGGTCAGGCQS